MTRVFELADGLTGGSFAAKPPGATSIFLAARRLSAGALAGQASAVTRTSAADDSL
jgi:hypothetical protein